MQTINWLGEISESKNRNYFLLSDKNDNHAAKYENESLIFWHEFSFVDGNARCFVQCIPPSLVLLNKNVFIV